MHHHYNDIRSKIDSEPIWFDEYGVPRYCKFVPDLCNNVYAAEVALLLISCQGCGKRFEVCMSVNMFELALNPDMKSLANQIEEGDIHYGDPPNTDCCPAGPTMNCIDIRVLEFWKWKKGETGWTRVPELEITLPEWD